MLLVFAVIFAKTFLELTNNLSTFQKVTRGHFCLKKVSWRLPIKEKAVKFFCLTTWLSGYTSQGLRFVEPCETLWLKGRNQGTSRLWVSQSDIPWDFVICNHSLLSVLYKIIIFFESQKIPLTEIVCLRIVYAELLERSAFVNSSAKLLSVTFITLSSSEV